MHALILFVLNKMICCTPALHQAILNDLQIIAAHQEQF
jgi:hypothetical protein